ncbi:hypothetical protein GQ53DRAFT_823903 [Thozetella sp. PMI_491]|nr:hypothetical protein GQ53DRAFT_823903 [Thozetella sp. PMI_491]
MPIPFILFLFWGLSSLTLASIQAGPYEALYFYYAYQLEQYLSGTNRRIAIKCIPSNGVPPCNFRAFINRVYGPGNVGTYDTINGPSPDDLPNLSVDDMAKKLYDGGFFDARFKPDILYDGLRSDALYKKALDGVTRQVAEATRLGAPAQAIDQATSAVSGILDGRIADNADAMTRAVQDSIESRLGINVAAVTETTAIGKTYQKIDWSLTGLSAAQVSAAQEEVVNFWKQIQAGSTVATFK